MDSADLVGQSILVIEDEPLIALDICEALKSAGASVFVANCLHDAFALAEHPDLSGAILDFGLRDGDAGPVSSGSIGAASPSCFTAAMRMRLRGA
jgi:CheY-like chemotaxis protein